MSGQTQDSNPENPATGIPRLESQGESGSR